MYKQQAEYEALLHGLEYLRDMGVW
jgi:hypothetical protein